MFSVGGRDGGEGRCIDGNKREGRGGPHFLVSGYAIFILTVYLVN